MKMDTSVATRARQALKIANQTGRYAYVIQDKGEAVRYIAVKRKGTKAQAKSLASGNWITIEFRTPIEVR